MEASKRIVKTKINKPVKAAPLLISHKLPCFTSCLTVTCFNSHSKIMQSKYNYPKSQIR